jgi:hypothetical protein
MAQDGPWVKAYFCTGTKKYKNDRSHLETRCAACIARRIIELTEVEEHDINSGMRDYMRSPEERRAQGVS